MLQTGAGKERLIFERVLTRCLVTYKTERENRLAEGSSKDLSDGGLGLFTRSKLEQNMHLEMRVKLTPEIKPLHINGKVVWSQEKRPSLWRAGICFDEMAFIRIVKVLVSKNLN